MDMISSYSYENTNTMNSGQNSELEIFNIQQLFKVFKIITKLLQFLYIGPQIKKDILVSVIRNYGCNIPMKFESLEAEAGGLVL